MKKDRLGELEKKLHEKREDLLRLIKKSRDYGQREIGDSVDIASDSASKEITCELNDNEILFLSEVDNAIQKIHRGSYGKCEECGIVISEERLNALPEARLCIKCQTNIENE